MEFRSIVDTGTEKFAEIVSYPFIWSIEKVKDYAVAYSIDYIASIPVMTGVSVGTYALLNMISERLAIFGVKVVFVAGALMVLVLR